MLKKAFWTAALGASLMLASPMAARADAQNFGPWLDAHPAIAQELYQHPDWLHDPNYLASRPDLAEFLADNPDVEGLPAPAYEAGDQSQAPYPDQNYDASAQPYPYAYPYAYPQPGFSVNLGVGNYWGGGYSGGYGGPGYGGGYWAQGFHRGFNGGYGNGFPGGFSNRQAIVTPHSFGSFHGNSGGGFHGFSSGSFHGNSGGFHSFSSGSFHGNSGGFHGRRH